MPSSNVIMFSSSWYIVIWSFFWCLPSVRIAIASQLWVIYWKITRYKIDIGWRCDWNIAIICGCVWTWTTIRAFFTTRTVGQIVWIAHNRNLYTFQFAYLAQEKTWFVDWSLSHGSSAYWIWFVDSWLSWHSLSQAWSKGSQSPWQSNNLIRVKNVRLISHDRSPESMSFDFCFNNSCPSSPNSHP